VWPLKNVSSFVVALPLSVGIVVLVLGISEYNCTLTVGTTSTLCHRSTSLLYVEGNSTSCGTRTILSTVGIKTQIPG
jgi:hypothetical protein